MSTCAASPRPRAVAATGSRPASRRPTTSTKSSPASSASSLSRADALTTHGLVVVDKPGAWTSHDVVAKLRKVYRQRRVGHAGTLDPDATGVLLVGLGRSTRLLRFLQEAGKAYRGTIVVGVSTTTLDAAGEVVDRHPMPVDRSDVEEAVAAFGGEIEQLAPMVSAVEDAGCPVHLP